MQRSLDLLHAYCRRCRVRVSSSKTQVMVTQVQAAKRVTRAQRVGSVGRPPSVTFTLGSRTLTQVEVYDYPGVTLTADLLWDVHKAAVVKRAERALSRLAGAGVSRGLFSTRTAVRLWKALVLPVVEYAVPVWGGGEWKAADALQYRAGRVILRVMGGTPKAAVRGELGWQRMEARREWLAVRYWCRLQSVNSADSTRYVVQQYRADRLRVEATPRRTSLKPLVGLAQVVYRRLHTHSQLTHHWAMQDGTHPPGDVVAGSSHEQQVVRSSGARWLLPALRQATRESEQQQWWSEVGALTSLRTYVQVKRRLELEGYLLDAGGVATVSGRRAAMDMARIRCGANDFAISTGRRDHRRWGQAVVCGSGAGVRRCRCRSVYVCGAASGCSRTTWWVVCSCSTLCAC